MAWVKSFVVLIVALAASCEKPLSLQVLRQKPDAESHQGTEYIMGFFQATPATLSKSDAALYISTQDPRGADVTIDIPRAADLYRSAGFPMNFRIGQFETRMVGFPSGRHGDLDIRVTTQNDRGIRIVSNNGAKLDIVGVNDEVRSTDAFLVLPCKLNNDMERGEFYISEYRYFIFSAYRAGSSYSNFLIIPCTSGGSNGNSGIKYTQPGATDSVTLPSLVQYETNLVIASHDLTGTVVVSPFPLAVFSGHECGEIPEGMVACDILIEQIPPDVTYGTKFFVVPFAVRESGDILRIGSTVDNNQVAITCTRRQVSGDTRHFTRTRVLNTGEFYEYQTYERITEPGLSSQDYRRYYCCIETTKPTIVMQYMPGFIKDRVMFANTADIGDPAMTLVPPVEQYRNDYIVVTPDEVLTTINDMTFNFYSFIGWAIAAEFFNPENGDGNHFLVNNETFFPSDRASGGSGEYIPFICRDGSICGYGGIGRIQTGRYQVSYQSPSDPLSAVYVSVYGFHREVSYAYLAGIECEPIGLPKISTYDVFVIEGRDSFARVTFNRTGGNLAYRSRIVASTVATEEGRAEMGSDFIALSNQRIVFSPHATDARMVTQNDRDFDVTIIDDDAAEGTEFFEVHFFVDHLAMSAGYAFPSSIARVTIFDNDGDPSCSFVETMYTVAEGEGAFVDVVVETTNFDGVGDSCVLNTVPGSAVEGSDYFAISGVPVVFTSPRAAVRIRIVNDDVVEADEMFEIMLSSSSLDVVILSQHTASIVITDSDRVTIYFQETVYSVAENSGSAEIVIIKEGVINEEIDLNFQTSDGTAVSNGGEDYSSVSKVITFPLTEASEDNVTVIVPITNDNVPEPDEYFSAMIAEMEESPDIGITIRTTRVEIINDDANTTLIAEFEEMRYVVDEGDVVNVTIVLSTPANRNVELDFITFHGNATAPDDYESVFQRVMIPAGKITTTIQVKTVEDVIVEPDEDFGARLVNPSEGLLIGASSVASIVITDNEASTAVIATFAETRYSVDEGDAVNITILLSTLANRDVDLDFITFDGSAQAPDDYELVLQRVVIPAGRTRTTVQVRTAQDVLSEPDEDFGAWLVNPSVGLIIGDNSVASIIILDNEASTEAIAEFAETRYRVDEGDVVNVTIVLSAPTNRNVELDFVTFDGSATAPGDFESVLQRVMIPAGRIGTTVHVRTVEDTLSEPDEDLRAQLVDPSEGLLIGANSITSIRILDNEDLKVLGEQLNYRVPEQDGTIEISLILNFEASEPLTVFGRAHNSNPPHAMENEDYIGGQISFFFPIGSKRASTSITIIDDMNSEDYEEIFLIDIVSIGPNNLNAEIGIASSITVTIVDNDGLFVQFEGRDYRVEEGGVIDLILVTNTPAPTDIEVDFGTFDGTAISPGDYNSVSQRVAIPEGMSRITIPVQTVEDVLAEPNENFRARLASPSGGVRVGSNSSASCTILDNEDLRVSMETSSYEVSESTEPFQVYVVLNYATDAPFTVRVIITEDNPKDAIDGEDFNAKTTTITFQPGSQREHVQVDIIDDNIVEIPPDETFIVEVTPGEPNPYRATAGPYSVVPVTIVDDDGKIVQISQPKYSVNEGDGTVRIGIGRDSIANDTITLTVNTQDGTAIAGVDYEGTSTNVTILRGEVMVLVDILIIDDFLAMEGNETFAVIITPPSDVSADITSSIVTITDNDVISLSFNDAVINVSENVPSGLVNVCLSPNTRSARDYVVVMAHRPSETNPATPNLDYVVPLENLILTIPAGEPTEQCIAVTIVDDVIPQEPQEVFIIYFSHIPDGVTIGPVTESIVIINDTSVGVKFSREVYVVSEGEEAVEICVERIGSPTDQPIVLSLAPRELQPADAQAWQDFSPELIEVIIQLDMDQACADIPILDDDLATEGDKEFQIEIVLREDSKIPKPPSALVRILNNDFIEVFFVTREIIVPEDVGTIRVCVNSSTHSDEEYSIGLAHSGFGENPATAEMDYDIELTVTFPACQCLDVNIIDDSLALEGNETFQFTIHPRPYIRVRTPEVARVTIIDNDLDVMVSFVSEEIEVNENNRTAKVCITRDVLTEEILNVPIVVTQGSHETNDFQAMTKHLTFAVGNHTLCTKIPIIHESTLETVRNLTVTFGQSMEFQPGHAAVSHVKVIENSKCRLEDAYVVRPFNNGQGYTYRGSCEIVAIQSCNDTERDFSVRVDYITATSDLGAVGVHKDEYIWVSREDGEFVSTGRNERVEADGSIFYPFNDVRVTRNTIANRTIISVGDGIGVTIVHNYGDQRSISISVVNGSSLLETCGICGTQNGQLIGLNGFIATTPVEHLRVVQTYRTAPLSQSLRPIRTECTQVHNYTVAGDPLFTVPLPAQSRRSLCFEIHGRPNTHFNLVSDTCVSVNALYTGVSTVDGPLNIISSIGVRAQDSLGNCQNIRVDLDQCGVSVGMNGALTSIEMADYSLEGISIRRRMTDRVRVSVPNCENVPLSMWVICERGNPVDMIRFQIARGNTLRSTSHGFLAQFWNVMVRVEPFTPPPGSRMEHDADKLYNITVQAADDPNNPDHSPMPPYRSFLGDLFPRTWDNTREECLYVGNAQGGPSAEFPVFRDSVIEGRYTDYIVDSIFATDFAYDRIMGKCSV